ncbi:Nucleophosmin, partial [Saguinus oedipus]
MTPSNGRVDGHKHETLRPQNYVFDCELKADKDNHFKVDNDKNEHQFSLGTVSLGADAKDELHIVETETM